jgi:tetratricopeptide (TPR) repeat protein
MRPHPLVVLLLASTLGLYAGGRAHAAKPANSAAAQLSFGVQMARQGLWSEALFRFREAEKLEPENPRVLSNIGVAYEAVGQYDSALGAYKKALQVAPTDKDIRNNYARFVEFYQGFKGEKKKGAEGKDAKDGKKAENEKKKPPLPQLPGFAPVPSADNPSPPEDEPPPPADNRPPL